MRSIIKQASENEHCLHQVRDSLFCHRVLQTHLSKDCLSFKANLNNYDRFTDLKEHIQSILELIT